MLQILDLNTYYFEPASMCQKALPFQIQKIYPYQSHLIWLSKDERALSCSILISS